jgi:hypothetical protein
MYLMGLHEDPEAQFWIQEAPEAPAIRRVAAGVPVIDLDAMRAELEANPAARRRT